MPRNPHPRAVASTHAQRNGAIDIGAFNAGWNAGARYVLDQVIEAASPMLALAKTIRDLEDTFD